MVQVEVSNAYIDMSVNNGSEKYSGLICIRRWTLFKMVAFIAFPSTIHDSLNGKLLRKNPLSFGPSSLVLQIRKSEIMSNTML